MPLLDAEGGHAGVASTVFRPDLERPEQVAALIREALKYIKPERLIISSDCGMGREGMGRRHAGYKMVSMVLGTNIIKNRIINTRIDCAVVAKAHLYYCRA